VGAGVGGAGVGTGVGAGVGGVGGGVGGFVGGSVGGGVGGGVGGCGVGGVGGVVGGAGVGAWQSALVMRASPPPSMLPLWHFPVAPGGHGQVNLLVAGLSQAPRR
jgi:hypothetical protein